jgi:four helix bundle protein
MHHEDTRLYKTMMLLVTDCAKAVSRIPRGNGKLVNQIKRSSQAVPAIFAEGARRRSPTDRAHYFDMASGSARETSSHVDVAHAGLLISTEDHVKIKDRCDHICAMLYKFR